MRVALLDLQMSLGARVGHAPGIDEAMMTTGPMNADYAELAAATDALTRRFDGADRAHLTGSGGTDLTLCIRGRAFQSDLGSSTAPCATCRGRDLVRPGGRRR